MKLFALPTFDEWNLFLKIFAAIVLFLGSVELLRFVFHGSREITRKTVHIVVGILIFFAPQLFYSGIPPLVFAFVFTLINFVTAKLGLLPSIHGTHRVSYGTVYYPLSLFVLIFLFWDSSPAILSSAIFIMALADAAAGIVGETLSQPHEYRLTSDKKSVEGSLTMFAVSFATILFTVHYFEFSLEKLNIYVTVSAIALFVTGWEAISSKGFDNFTVPMGGAFALYYFFVPLPHHIPEQLLIGIALGICIAIISYYFSFLSLSGSVATFLLASIIYGIGGWKWTIPILTFFILSSLLSKFGKKKKQNLEIVFDKTDKRDEGQVAANGGIPALLALVWFAFPDFNEAYLLYLAAIASVTADTWGTEIGTLFKRKPFLLTTFKKVEVGTNGAVSLNGMLGGITGAALIALAGMLMDANLTMVMFIKIIFSGFIGSLIDSILGETIQGTYQIQSSGKITERTMVAGIPTKLVKGFAWIDNDIVNWLCAVSGTLCMWILL